MDGVEARDGKAEKKLERKAENFSAGALLCGVCGFGGYAGVSVSYTHLDVYKRQGYGQAGGISSSGIRRSARDPYQGTGPQRSGSEQR